MTSPLRTTKSGLDFIKRFEGYRSRAFRLPDGRWTIGHGHVRSAREGVTINKDDAEALLIYDLRRIEAELDECLLSPLNPAQYDAIVSFVYNISPGQFRQSEVLRLINRGDHIAAAHALEAWRKARINGKSMVVDALVRRRAAEKAMFLRHPAGPALCPTPLIAPEFDSQWRQKTTAESSVEPPQAAASSVQQVAEAVEALAAQSKPIPPKQKPKSQLTPEIQTPAANDDHADAVNDDMSTPRPPSADEPSRDSPGADIVDHLKSRINRVLAREEAVAEAKESARRQAESEPVGVQLKDDHDDVVGRSESVEFKAPAFSGAEKHGEAGVVRRGASNNDLSSEDAFGLSSRFSDIEEAAQVEPANIAPTSARGKGASISGPAITPSIQTGTSSQNEGKTVPRTGGKSIWGAALVGAFALIIWGVFDFVRASRAAHDVSRQDVVFGPMLVLLGLVLSMIAIYYFFARRDDAKLI